MAKVYTFNTESLSNLFTDHSLYENREKMARFTTKDYKSEVTVVIQMYKDLDKAKHCVESVLKYSQNVDFDLMLMIDGPKDGLFEYFKNIEYEKTTIIYNTANRGGLVPWNFVSMDMFSEFIVDLAGDIVVTENWLSNLMACIKSDPTIGMVVPVSSNSSNLQEYNIGVFSNYDEMQQLASVHNKSDPRKWEERLRIVTLAPILRKSALYATGIPLSDAGFAHNFSDDDLSFRIRRMGYKNVVANDTWIHHDHERVVTTIEEYNAYNNNIALGKKDFNNKYYGLDAWDDVNNFIYFRNKIIETESDAPQILGIDCRCGSPILDLKNRVRQFDKYDSECYAITSEAKYFLDLQSVCGAENVVCGDTIHCLDKFVNGSMDYIIIDKPINQYPEPFELITKCATLLKNDGHIYVYLKNPYSFMSYLEMLGYISDNKTEPSYNYSYNQFVKKVKEMGGVIDCIYTEFFNEEEAGNYTEITKKCVQKTVNMSGKPQVLLDRLMTKRWAFDIQLG